MAYAGICTGNDLQFHSDPYFHAGSLDEIHTFLNTDAGCAMGSATGNSPPVPNAGANYVIPANTPFVLTASATDPDGDALTYCWEQMDLGPSASLSAGDSGSGPLFRSFLPTTSPVRYFPKLSSVLANTNWNQEKLPTTSRTMNFRVTVRDNRPGGGGVADDDMTVTVVGTAGPFRVTSPNTAVAWAGNQTVTWNVAGTTAAPINASSVNIFLSVDGGQTFSYQLATNVPNTGSRLVTLPNVSTSQARVKVQAAGNIFYDISDANFTIVPSGPFVSVSNAVVTSESCFPTNGWIDPFETVTVNFTFQNTGTAPTTNLVVTLLQTNGIYYPGAPQNIGVIPVGSTATRSFQFTPSGSCGGSLTALFQLSDNGTSLGTAAWPFTLGSVQSTIVTQVFNNPGFIVIQDADVAWPYPSSINVGGVSGEVVKVTVTLNGLSHTYPDDIGMLLVAPNGRAVKLMDACGGDGDLSFINLTFDDAAPASLPDSTQIFGGTYRPTDNFPNDGLEGTPPPPYQTTLLSLGTVPNGTWSLYIQDFNVADFGDISGGWTLRIVSSNAVVSCCSTFPQPSFTSMTREGELVRFSWSAIPGPNYQVQYRTNLTVGSWQNFGGPIPGTNMVLTVTDSVAAEPVRFYRVIVLP